MWTNEMDNNSIESVFRCSIGESAKCIKYSEDKEIWIEVICKFDESKEWELYIKSAPMSVSELKGLWNQRALIRMINTI